MCRVESRKVNFRDFGWRLELAKESVGRRDRGTVGGSPVTPEALEAMRLSGQEAA